MKILVCNVGSTSLKFKLYEMPEKTVYATGKVERVGSTSEAIYSFCNVRTGEKIAKDHLSVPRYKDGIALFLGDLLDKKLGILSDIAEISAVGFKTVLAKGHHGVFELNDETLAAMRDYLFIAPAHNQPYLDAIGEFKAMLPNALLVGSFETAFHKTIPKERKLYALPYEWYEKYGVMRMGYHGASHGYIAERLKAHRRVISCHLGGSGSLCAILDGKSVDNSFGFSLQAGILHAQRTGDMDVYIIPYLLEQGLSMDEILFGLCKNGGLKGISGTSGDLRDVQAAADAGSERARLALDVYATQLLRYIGAYYMELSGADAIAFTGGIGENSWRLREMLLDRLAHIGVKYDRALNRSVKGEQLISTSDSAVAVYVIPANEELIVVRSVWTWLSERV